MKSLFKKKAQSIIGLDIGTKYVKAVCLDVSGSVAKVNAFACEPIIGAAFNEREIKDFDAVSKALAKIKHNLKTKNKNVAIAVAGSSVLSKVVFMEPNQTDFELESQIEIEADSLIPYPLEEVYLDFEELGESKTHGGKVEVLLSAAHKDMIDSRITLVREAPFDPVVMDIEGYALGNALIHFATHRKDCPTCCINVGASLLQVCFVEDGEVIYSKEHNFGMNKFIQDLAVIHSLDIQEVENQIADGSAPESWFKETLPMFLSALQQQIQRALQMYASTTHKQQPEKILISGGAGSLPTLVEELSKDLGIKVEAFNPFTNLIIGENVDVERLNKFAAQLAIAAGLASRSYSQWHM
jgi:type IV pilus assembly protein PilM